MKTKPPEVIIRDIQDGDEKHIFKHNSKKLKNYFISFQSLTEVASWLDTVLYEIKQGTRLEYVITNTRGTFIGMVSVRHIHTPYPEIGIWVRSDMCKKGYATAALTTLFQGLQNTYKNKTIIYDAELENRTSIQLARKLQLQEIGIVTENNIEYTRFIYKI